MSCLENNKKKAESKLSDGLLLTNPQKQKYISSIAANDLNDFFELLQKFDVRVSVYKDASGKYTVTESSKDKLVNDLQISDDLERIYTIDTNKAFYSAEDKHKIASTATVDAILGSIPFVKEIPRIVDIKRQKYTYSEHLPITKARQLLYKIYVTNGIVPSSDVMAETILRKIDSDTLSNDDKRILLSIYNYVFSDVNLEYKDSLGKTTFLKSLKTISKTGPHPEIRDRARNYTSMFHTAITAINNFSYLMIITEDGNTVKTQDDTMLYRMSSVNAPQVNNLFEVLEIIDETQKERELIDVQLKQSVIDSFKDNNIGIVNQLVDGKVVTAAKFTHTDTNTGKKLDIVIPFNLSTNKSDIVSIGNLYKSNVDQFTQKFIIEGENDFNAKAKAEQLTNSVLANPDIILPILEKIGYKGIVDRGVINYILNSSFTNPENKKEYFTQNVNNLWKLIASGIVSISANIENAKLEGKLDSTHNFINTNSLTLSDFLKTIREAFKGVSFDNNPNNNNKSFRASSLVEDGLDVKEFDSSVISPTGFWKNNQWLTTQIMGANNIYRKTSQRDVNDENVNTDNINSRAELINKYILDIRKVPSSVFRHNPFVSKVASIEGVARISGYKDTSTKDGKSHMSMNTTDIHGTYSAAFVNELLKNYDQNNRVAPVAFVVPQTYSDKSFWAGFVTRFYNHDFFPIKNNKIDIVNLLDKQLINQRTQDRDFLHNFLREWNKMYYCDPITGNKIEILGNKIDENLAYTGSKEQIESLFSRFEIEIDKGSPVSGLENKYYNLNTKGDKWKITISPLLKDKLLRQFQSDLDYKFHLLGKLAEDHNNINRNQSSLSENNKFNQNINKKLKSILDSKVHNITLDLGKKYDIDLSKIMNLVVDPVSGLNYPIVDKLGKFSLLPNLTQKNLDDFISHLSDIHPVELSMFFAHNYTNTHINELLLGSSFQYKNGSEDGMLVDMLKRSVSAASPGIPMSLDESLYSEKEDLRMTRFSDALFLRDYEASAPVLGTGTIEKVVTDDGGSYTSSLAEKLYQTSFGGVQGLVPNSSLKFFYSHTDLENGDTNLVKYALHVITEEMINSGTLRMLNYYKLMLGSKNLGREIILPDVMLDGEVLVPSKIFSANDTLFSIYLHIKTNKDLIKPSFSTDTILLDLIRENPDLKKRMVHQLIKESSNKTGKALYHNYESLKSRLDLGETLQDHEFRTLDNADLTMQLDATHDPENGTVSKFSQAIVNMIQEGRTYYIANEVLETMAKLVGVNLEKIRNQFSNGIFDFKKDHNVSSFRLENVSEFKELYRDYKDKPDFDDILINKFNSKDISSKRRRDLFIRSIVLDSMEQQDNDNTTYKDIESDNFSMQSPQVASLIESGVRAFINRKTVAMKFSGGNYILAPTHDLFDVKTLTKDGQVLRVLGKNTANRRIKEGWEEVEGNNNLNWTLATNNIDPKISIYETEEWKNFSIHSESNGDKPTWYLLRQSLQKLLDSKDQNGNLIWKINPAEIIMPYAFKKNFGIISGMQPSDATVEYFAKTIATERYLKDLNFKWNSLVEKDDVVESFKTHFSELAKTNPDYQKIASFTYHDFQRLVSLNNKGLDLENLSELFDVDPSTIFDVLSEFRNFTESIGLTEKAKIDFIESTIDDLALIKYNNFQKSLETIVGRIPSTGLQSIVPTKVIGFVESNKNSLWFPKELMMIQGADLDIDKAVVLSWWFDNNGNLITDESTPEGLQNKITQLQFDIISHPSNLIASNSPVQMTEAQEEKERRNAGNVYPFKASVESLFSVIVQKVLASEGKAMVGVVMNLYKAYNLIYYTDLKLRKKGNNSPESKTTVKPISLYVGTDTPVTKETIANIDPEKAGRQAWAFFSTMGNAATDNAKEMILGAIKANLQTGNIIGLLTCYGYEVPDIFNFLSQPIIQKVMEKVRHSTDIQNDVKIPVTIENAVKEIYSDKLSETDKQYLNNLLKINKSAEELQKLASALGINREVPVTPYDRFNYKQKIENYINELFEEKKLAHNFDLGKFLEDQEYVKSMREAYRDVQSSFNVLSVLEETPDIKMYLVSSKYVDTIIKELSPKHVLTEEIISRFKKKYPENKFKNVSEQEYKGSIKFLEEFTISSYIQQSSNFENLSMYLENDSSLVDESSLQSIAQFQEVFPAFLQELQNDPKNRSFMNNKFFSSLKPMTNAKGNYLIVPNIQDLSPTEQYELQSALNMFKSDINYKGTVITNKEFRRMLFLYSVVNSKGKVSTTSFFELMDPSFKKEFGYTDYLNLNQNIAQGVLENNPLSIDHLASSLTSLLPDGYPYFRDGVNESQDGTIYKNNKTSFLAKIGETIPPFVKARFNGKLQTYKLDYILGETGVQELRYSIIKPIYRSTSLSVSSDFSEKTHITTSHIYKTVNDPGKTFAISKMKAGNSVPLVIKTKNKLSKEIMVTLSVGEYLYNQSEQLLKPKCN